MVLLGSVLIFAAFLLIFVVVEIAILKQFMGISLAAMVVLGLGIMVAVLYRSHGFEKGTYFRPDSKRQKKKAR
ncbi:MAG: hypothetical protein HC945_02430 [Nitrosarchaeum sp.]|nr:hypothetical protein [Nitrosarchaeum sp.]